MRMLNEMIADKLYAERFVSQLLSPVEHRAHLAASVVLPESTRAEIADWNAQVEKRKAAKAELKRARRAAELVQKWHGKVAG